MHDRDNHSNENVRLRAASHFEAVAGGDRLLLISEAEEHVLDGAIYVSIAKALSRDLRWSDLRAMLSPHFSLEEIAAAMTALAEVGYVQRAKGHIDHPGVVAWIDSIRGGTGGRHIELKNLSSAGTRVIEEWFHQAGVTISGDAPRTIVLTDDYLGPALKEWNSRAMKPWLPAKVTGHTIWLGPQFRPGQAPCWECLAWWLRMHRWKQRGIASRAENPLRPALAHWDATVAIGFGMLVSAGLTSTLDGELLTFDTRTALQTRHSVRSAPGCSVCDGEMTTSPPDLRSFVSFATGIVERLDFSAQATGGLFHARATFVHPLPPPSAAAVFHPAEAFGKGGTVENAGTVAIAEAIERYSMTWRGSEATVLARSMGIDSILPHQLSQFSDLQYTNREQQTHSEHSPFWVPHPLPDEAIIQWIECRSITNPASACYVPAAAVFYGYPFETPYRYVIADSNGCAAGPTFNEALASALGELVERDALAIWWYNRLRRPAVHLLDEDLDDATFEILSALRSEGRSISVLDVTTDLAIPAYVVTAPREDGSDVVFSAAAHICPRRALHKALAEASQIKYWKEQVTPDSPLAQWLLVANTRSPEFEWLAPDGETELPPRRRLAPAEIVAAYVHRFESCGISSFYIDVTRPETGVPVVRAIAPGLRHPWSRFAPGRLYDVPVRMGWQQQRIEEGLLNPIGCML